jgi:peptidoglycan/xylan/chitin deacetylase (PgdA/CDA1 family)
MLRIFISALLLSSLLFAFNINLGKPSGIGAGSPPDALISVLCYHHLDLAKPKNSPYSVSSDLFLRQLDALQQSGFQFITLKQLSDFYYQNKPLPRLSVLLTFDDGNHNTFTNAYPLLKQRNLPFVLFIYPSSVFAGHNWAFMDWNDVRTLVSGNIEIGSHAMFHPYLTRPPKNIVSPAQYDSWLNKELAGSRTLIEKQLGVPVTAISIPFGAEDGKVNNRLAPSGYRLAFTINDMNNDRGSDPLNLSRILVYPSDTPEALVRKALLRPLHFKAVTPPDLSRVVSTDVTVAFILRNSSQFQRASVTLDVASLRRMDEHYDPVTDQHSARVRLTTERFYISVVKAKDRSGNGYKGTWLFQHNKALPPFLP